MKKDFNGSKRKFILAIIVLFLFGLAISATVISLAAYEPATVAHDSSNNPIVITVPPAR